MTNSPVFPGHVLFSHPVLAVLMAVFFYKVMKMSWFSENRERSALQQNIDGQTRMMRKKSRI